MQYQYVVILKRNSERSVDLLSTLLCLFSAVCFIYANIIAGHLNYFLLLVAGYLLKGVVMNGIVRPGKGIPVVYRYYLLVAGLGWIAMPFLPWLCALFVLLAFLEGQAKHPLEIGFDTDRVVINTLIRRKHAWSAFNNIILKDGLLTLDFKNNRLLQQKVADEEDEDDADEEEFNDFCRGRLDAVARS
jgi:hypothetical protein